VVSASPNGFACSVPLRDTARAMLHENVELVRSAIDAYNREDWDMDALRELYHPDAILQVIHSALPLR
jgi:hypothetical protein